MSKTTPPASAYTEEYFLTRNDGYAAFLVGKTPRRIRKVLFFLNPGKDERILDIGSGRGELLKECVNAGAMAVGVDYSADAVKISASHARSATVIHASATGLPFTDENFDKVTLVDVTEHLDDDDLHTCLIEAKRVLKDGGMLLIHTPNLWNHLLSFLWLSATGGGEHVSNPISSGYSSTTLHVNEKSALGLTRVLRRVGFRVQVRTALESRKNLAHLQARMLDKLLGYIFGTYYLCSKRP